MNNHDRAERAKELIKLGYNEGLLDETIDTGEDTPITDTLANLMHLCDQEGISFGQCMAMATVHYNEEIEEERA